MASGALPASAREHASERCLGGNSPGSINHFLNQAEADDLMGLGHI